MTYYDAEIEYLESDGNQFIDTGFYPNQDTGLKAELAFGTFNSWEVILGCREKVDTKEFTIQRSNNYGRLRALYGLARTANQLPNVDTNRFSLNWNKRVITVNNTTHTFASQTFTVPYTLYLYGLHSSTSEYYKGKFWYCQIYDNDTLVRDFIPVRIGSVGYMYDKVSDRLFGNSGTGSFVLGPDVAGWPGVTGKPKVSSIRRLMILLMPKPKYKQIDYLFTTGNAYIDTGVYPSSTIAVECSYDSYDAYSYQTVFGTRTALNTNSFSFLVYNGTVSATTSRFCYGNQASGWTTVPIKYNGTVKIDGGILYSENSQVGDVSSYSTFNDPNTISLMAETIGSGQKASYFIGKIYYCKIWDNEVLIRDFIPVKDSSGVCGLLDKVNNVFYTSPVGTLRDYEFSSSVVVSNGMGLTYETGNYNTSGGKQSYANVCIVPVEYEKVASITVNKKTQDKYYMMPVTLNSSKNVVLKGLGPTRKPSAVKYITAIFWDKPELTYPESIEWTMTLYFI